MIEHDTEVVTQAAWQGRLEAVREMLSTGFKPDQVNQNGETALHCAAFKGHLAVVQLLLEHAAPLEGRDIHFNCTPLEWALAGTEKVRETNPHGDYVGVVKALLAAGAKPPEKPCGRADVRAVLEKHTAR